MADEVKKTVVIETKVEGQKTISQLAGDVRIAGVSFDDLKGSVTGSARALKGAIVGLGGFGKALKLLVASAGPIGLLLTALAAVITFFKETRAGSEFLSDAINVLGAVVNELIGRFAKLGEAVLKLVTGDFKGFLEDTKSAFDGIGESIAIAIDRANVLSALRRSITQGEAAGAQAIANLKKEQQDLLLITRQRQDDAEENLKLLDQAIEKQERIERIQLNLAQIRVRTAKLAVEEEGEGAKQLDLIAELAFAQADLATQEATSAATLRELANRVFTEEQKVIRQRIDEAKRLEEERTIREQAETEEAANRQVFVTDQKEDLRSLQELEARGAKANLEAGGKLIDQIAEKRRLENEAFQTREDEIAALAQLERDQAADSLDLLGSIASQTAALGLESAGLTKSIALFESIVNTASAIVRALPNVPLAIAIGALGLAQTAKIASTPLPTMAEGGPIDIGGNRHSSGGTKFYGTDGTAFEAERGEKLFVLSRTSSEAFSNLSSFNSIFSSNAGGSFLQEGGLVTPGIAGVNSDFNVAQFTADIIRQLPAPEVSVLKIERARQEVAVTRRRAELN